MGQEELGSSTQLEGLALKRSRKECIQKQEGKKEMEEDTDTQEVKRREIESDAIFYGKVLC